MSDTVQLSDQYLLASSLKSDPEVHTSKGKKVVYVSDLNQGSYQSGLITIDATNQLNGSQGFASLKEAYLTVPYVVTAKNTGTGLSGQPGRFAIAPKCGVWNFISDLEVELNGKQVLTTNEYKNFWNNVRAMTEISQADIVKHGSDMFLAPDDWSSINFAAAISGNGDGYANNSIDITSKFDNTLNQGQEPKAYNSGFCTRVSSTPMPIDPTTNAAFGWPSLASAAQKQIVQQSGRSCWIENVNATGFRIDAGNISGVWVYILKIRLTDLHPLFKELDLVANPQLKLRYRVNAGTTMIKGSAVANQFSLGSTTMTSGNVCPIMVSAATSDAHPMWGVFGTSGTQQLSVAFGPLQNQFTSTAQIGDVLPYSTTRLNIPFYDLADPRPIISKPIKTVRYLDAFAQYFKQRAGMGTSTSGQMNAAFNFQLSASLKNLKYVALIPFAETSAGHWESAHGTEQFQSPFDSAPWTCQPGASVRNFQVQLGNQNVFAKTHEFDYESFMDEFSKIGAINGDCSREMNNGLVDLDHWTFAQRIMVADCSRISEKDVPSSIQVSGINSCSQGSNYLILAVYERSLELDRLTGEVVRFD